MMDLPEEKRHLANLDGPPNLSSTLSGEDELPQWTKTEDSSREISTRDKILNVQAILLNFSSTVTIVFMNKTVFADPQLAHCQIFVAAWHFTCTFLLLYVATRSPFNAFKAVRLPISQMLPISTFFAGFLILGNLSLAYNPVGFYQLAKGLNTPCVVLLNFLLFRVSVSKETLAAIGCVCLGVTLTNGQAALSNWIGTLIAAASFTVSALYMIWIGKKIVDLGVSAPQLLLNQAPVSVMLLLVLMPFIDTIPQLSEPICAFPRLTAVAKKTTDIIPSKVLWTLFGSGILASLLNLSQFLIIGRTSALTFNIVSNLKTITIVSVSWYQEGRAPKLLDYLGVVLALGGAYAYLQIPQKK